MARVDPDPHDNNSPSCRDRANPVDRDTSCNDKDPGCFAPEDEIGFAVPVTPSHSLRLLNDYMRTDLLLDIHRHILEMMDQKRRGSPIHHLATSLDKVIRAFETTNLFECVSRNRLHIQPGRDFRPEQDYSHDIRLMKHHRQCLKETIADLNRYS